ncbi:MaoC family dehydratase [Amycolatopsis sp. Hca4]|uniref:MaoC family dehydratase n=1 Tax=Amycolatopsis sp. Hca4 TaxID=2742131 RepID=UPI0015910FFB|nr:MaoC family dehydratase [Amycolatopsis sp. Hca4]QKV78454.1 MaoC family dehydratase [Amycolatopsis sp. Hca4]
MIDRYFEDYVPGVTYDCGSVEVTDAEILDFARRYDPQEFHVDAAAAADGPFGGLIASGWHTASLMMRLYAEHYLSAASSLGSPGVDELRWPRPVRPGAVLRLRATVTEARRSRTKPDRGVVRTRVEFVDGGDDVVFSASVLNLIRVRPAGPGRAPAG